LRTDSQDAEKYQRHTERGTTHAVISARHIDCSSIGLSSFLARGGKYRRENIGAARVCHNQAMSVVQIFGVKNSQATRAAERFFKERRVQIQFVDLARKPMAPAEIKRFIDKFTLAGLLDIHSAAYANAGLKYLKLSDAQLLERIERDPKLLLLPLVRMANRVTLGGDQDSWATMISAPAR
jgi:arsenate reductase